MHVAKAPETPEQYLKLGSGRFRGLYLLKDTQMRGGREDVSSLPSTFELLSTGCTWGGKDRVSREGLSQEGQVLGLHIAGH